MISKLRHWLFRMSLPRWVRRGIDWRPLTAEDVRRTKELAAKHGWD